MELSLGLIHMKLGRETLIKQRLMGFFLHLCITSQTSDDKWRLLFRSNLIFSRQSTSSLRIFNISSKSVFVSGNTDFKR